MTTKNLIFLITIILLSIFTILFYEGFLVGNDTINIDNPTQDVVNETHGEDGHA